MNSLGPFPWHLIDMEQLNAISSRIASSFSPVVLTDPNDVTNAFFECVFIYWNVQHKVLPFSSFDLNFFHSFVVMSTS